MPNKLHFSNIVIILIIATLCGFYAYGIGRDRIFQAYDSFLKNPSGTTVDQLIELLPAEPCLIDRGQDETGNTLEYIFEDNRFGKLDILNAFNVLFKLKIITDGHRAEWVDIF